jgi:hypothetical protein
MEELGMSNTRGHDCVYVAGHEARAKKLLQSKAGHNMFIVNFLQRRMNTSYTKKLYWCRRDSSFVYVRERWEIVNREEDFNATTFPESVIELVIHMGQAREVVIGRAYASGEIRLNKYVVKNMPKHMKRQVEQHLYVMYTRTENADDFSFVHKNTSAVPRVSAPVSTQDGFADVMNREWRV